MSIIQTVPPVPAQETPPPARDGAIDVVRAACVLVVVALHALMAGVVVDASGAVFLNTAEGAAWFAPLSWIAQVMPLFFVIGGFAGAAAYRRSTARGGTAVAFVAARAHRLLVPAIVSIGLVGAALAALALAGVPAEFVAVAGFRYGQPLWFLGVFLLCQALLPALLAAHDRAPVRSILGLVAAALAVDLVRAATGIDAIGFLNLAFVWLALQQVGFFLADGRIDALHRRTRIAAGVGAVVILAATFVTGMLSPDLYANLNPPTVALLLVGVAQTALLSLARPWLASFSQRPRVTAFTSFVTARAMTIYLWHMPVILGMAGVVALLGLTTGMPVPEPSSVEWWLTRPVWIGVALALTALVALGLAFAERRPVPVATTSRPRVAGAVVLGLSGIVLLLATGTSVLTAAIALVLLGLALRRIRSEKSLLTPRR